MSNWAAPPSRPPVAGDLPCDVRLDLPADAEQVVIARHVVAALAESLRFSQTLIEDVKLAVTEACTNVVRHAYAPCGDGRLRIAAAAKEDALEVRVIDDGSGISLGPRLDGPGGLGLPLMAALTKDLAIERSGAGGSGTVIRMSFAATE